MSRYIRILAIVMTVITIAAAGAPGVSTAQSSDSVEFEYAESPENSVSLNAGSIYTHEFAVSTNATNGPLILTTYYDQSANISYDAHTVEFNGSDVETEQAIKNTTVDGSELTRVQLTVRSPPGESTRMLNVSVDLSINDPDGGPVYTGGTHGPTGSRLSLQTTTITEDDGSGSGDGEDSGSGSSGGGGGGGGGVPPSATDGTGVDVPNISSDLGEQATITAESEPIITEQNETRSTATFAESFPLLEAVTFTKTGPFADDIEGTVNARAIDGDPAATGTPDGSTVSLAHVTMPNQNMSQVELRYVISESRLSEIGASADEVTAHRFDGSSWQDVDVEVTEETETGTVLIAELSNPTTTYVALTAPAAEGDATDEEMSDQSDDSAGTASDDSIPGFGMIAALLAIITILGMLSRRQ